MFLFFWDMICQIINYQCRTVLAIIGHIQYTKIDKHIQKCPKKRFYISSIYLQQYNLLLNLNKNYENFISLWRLNHSNEALGGVGSLLVSIRLAGI